MKDWVGVKFRQLRSGSMSVSYYEQFTGYDWETISARCGSISPLVVGSAGILSIWLKMNILVSVYMVFAALVLAIWEFPIIYSCVPQFEALQTLLLEKMYLKMHLPRTFVYAALSIICFSGGWLCILSAMYMDTVALLYLFAFINRRSDVMDGTAANMEAANKEAGGGLLGPNSQFGTF
jgi:hypothetical protein